VGSFSHAPPMWMNPFVILYTEPVLVERHENGFLANGYTAGLHAGEQQAQAAPLQAGGDTCRSRRPSVRTPMLAHGGLYEG
jgi:hypothetical protein